MYTNHTSKSRSLQNTFPIGQALPSKFVASTAVHSRRILYGLIATFKYHINGHVLLTKYNITEIIVIRRTCYAILFPAIILSWVFCILCAIKIKYNYIIQVLRYLLYNCAPIWWLHVFGYIYYKCNIHRTIGSCMS